jgi:hypothetical protein
MAQVQGGTMKGHVMVALAAAVALCGCSRRPATQQEATSSTAVDTNDRLLTIVGCLVPGSTTTQRTAARPSGSPPPPDFTLVDVTIPAQGTDAPSGVSGTSGRMSGTPRSYELVADKNRLDDLQRFANSRVEISGSIVAPTGTGAPDAGAGSAPVATSSADVRSLRVKDVRQLEPTCGASKKP